MTAVGVRDLKAHLSKHLREVADGEEIVVTDRGTPVARIVPISATDEWMRLVESGVVTPAQTGVHPDPAPVAGAGAVSDLVAEQRGHGDCLP